MTSYLNSHGTTDIKPEMLTGVQTGNGTPHDKYNTRGIAHVRKNRKDDIFMQRRLVQSFTYILEWEWGTWKLTKHTRCWTYSTFYISCNSLHSCILCRLVLKSFPALHFRLKPCVVSSYIYEVAYSYILCNFVLCTLFYIHTLSTYM